VAVDSSGNVVVTGTSYGGSSFGDYATIKYSSAGVPLWTNRFNGPTNSDDRASALAVDGSGNVLVTGNSYAPSRSDYATIKYSSTGVPLWTNRYSGPGNYNDIATGLTVDSSGNVFVAGSSYAANGADYATIKYSGAGVPLWTNRYIDGSATALAVDSGGNVIVTGYADGANGRDYATVKYSGAGVPLWTNRFNGPGAYGDYASAVVVDSNGNVVVTGHSFSTNQNPYNLRYATIKYSSAGVPLWTNYYKPPGNGNNIPTALAVDGGGNVIVTGNLDSTDIATIKYSGAGVPLWTNRYDGGRAKALAVDGSGNVVVTGYSINSDGSTDYLTIKYSPAGMPLLTITRTPTNTVAVSWPSVGSAGFGLEETSTLAAPVPWVTNTATVTDDGTNKSASFPATNAAHFFRLRR
jgi:uncharacterized delta-60 repeat protein